MISIFVSYWANEKVYVSERFSVRSLLAVTFPDLRMHSPLLDPRDVHELPPTEKNPYHNRVVIRNHRSVFHDYPDWETEMEAEDAPEREEQDDFMKSLPVSNKYFRGLHQAILMRRSVVQQTPKGKIRRIS